MIILYARCYEFDKYIFKVHYSSFFEFNEKLIFKNLQIIILNYKIVNYIIMIIRVHKSTKM